MANHLDLGCGENPRNPFHADCLFGVDIADLGVRSDADQGFTYVQSDVFFQPFPFETSYFDSISAYDFIEHVPRITFPNHAFLGSKSPFMHVMSEIFRCLKPGGILIASTPAYPSPKAFQDPTHVNIITIATHTYFCGSNPYALRYGFEGQFDCEVAKWDAEKNAWNPSGNLIRKWYRNLEFRLFKGGLSHITWRLRALK